VSSTRPHRILFTGHRIDSPERPVPRFPPDKESLARSAIRDAVRSVLEFNRDAVGIAGGASGGDILFHEICEELGIPTLLWLALPPEQYLSASVEPAGRAWVDRFRFVYSRASSRLISADTAPPSNIAEGDLDDSFWKRSDLSMLDEALSGGVEHATVIALWNGQEADAPGGVSEVVAASRTRGVRTVVLDSDRIFGLGPPGSRREP
jgi:hypothetical protein